MGKLSLFVTVVTIFAFAISSNGENVQMAVDEAKISPFTKIGENYYKFEFEQAFTWFGAAHACRRMDAQLATIGSEQEWQELSSYMVSNGFIQRFWFSGNDLDTEDEYYWLSNGQKMDYLKWAPGQPSKTGGNEHCLEMLRWNDQYLMNDAPWNLKFGYICQVASPKIITITTW